MSMSFGTKIRTTVFWIEIHMNADKFILVAISVDVEGHKITHYLDREGHKIRTKNYPQIYTPLP